MSSPPSPSPHISSSAWKTSFGLGRKTVGEKIQIKNSISNWTPTSHRTVCFEITRLGERTSIARFIYALVIHRPCHFERETCFSVAPGGQQVPRRCAPRHDKFW